MADAKYDKDGKLTREGAHAALKEGGSVMVNGTVYTSIEALDKVMAGDQPVDQVRLTQTETTGATPPVAPKEGDLTQEPIPPTHEGKTDAEKPGAAPSPAPVKSTDDIFATQVPETGQAPEAPQDGRRRR